jgi:radical SAM superfamily enzyme YgiQ (UPF0313 family)
VKKFRTSGACVLISSRGRKYAAAHGRQLTSNTMSNILLINPPVYDFAAFDLWSKPLGLLYLASILKNQGHKVSLLDYMDRGSKAMFYQAELRQSFYGTEPSGKASRNFDKYGCGHYIKSPVKKPDALKHIPRKYSRYGLTPEFAVKYLKELCVPDIIIVTSVMTYWYLGVFEAIETVKNVFPSAPVILGGTYATLCYEHAQKSGADAVLKGDLFSLNKFFQETNINASVPRDFSDFPIPYYPLNQNTRYAALRISQGCPFRCSYCAQDSLSGGNFISKPYEKAFAEIKTFADRGIKNVVFYDDALLYDADNSLKPLLKKIIRAKLDINIHTPNGLHLRYLDLELAQLMKKANFICPRFSLETSNTSLQKSTGSKISNETFEEKAAILSEAGFKKSGFLIYLLMGIPGQTLEDVEESIRYVHKFGGRVSLSEYSYIPQTKDFQNAPQIYKEEPLLHNKSVYPSYNIGDWTKIYEVKNLAIKLNSLL